jgi:hypothetical protein
MLCQVEQDLNSHEVSFESGNSALSHWKWCFEGEFRFLKESVSGGKLNLKDMDEVKECIESIFDESSNFEINNAVYDFSDSFQEFLDNL